MTYEDRRQQRIAFVKSLFAQIDTPCAWCPQERPGQRVNMVNVAVQGSTGMCKECAALVSKEIDDLDNIKNG